MRQTDLTHSIDTFQNIGTQIIAGGAGDNDVIKGAALDRTGYMSAHVVGSAIANLTAAKTCKFKVKLQHSVDTTDGNFTDFIDYSAEVTLTGAGGGSIEKNKAEVGGTLRPAHKYIRAVLFGDLSAAATDVGAYSGVIVLEGKDQI
jgi:hypothetical protein